MVMLTSAIIHELILTNSLRMFFPALFLLFFVTGMVGSWCKVKDENASHIVWKFLFFWGSGFMVTAYSIEYSARYYLPIPKNTLIDHIVPRTFSLVV